MTSTSLKAPAYTSKMHHGDVQVRTSVARFPTPGSGCHKEGPSLSHVRSTHCDHNHLLASSGSGCCVAIEKVGVLCPSGEVRETKWSKQTRSRKWTFLYHFAIVAATFVMMMQALLMILGLVESLYAESIPLDVFQVYQPVTFAPQSENRCDLNVLLMEHVFGASYGEPFVGQ